MKQPAITLRVRYAETDAQGIVHHSNYLVWFEVGRTEMFRHLGLPYSELEKMGYMIVVAKAELKYHHPAFYDDEIRVVPTVETSKGRMIQIGYRVFNQQDQLLVSGTTTHMLLDADRKPCRIPEEMAALLAQLQSER